jgi:hypothetical protein
MEEALIGSLKVTAINEPVGTPMDLFRRAHRCDRRWGRVGLPRSDYSGHRLNECLRNRIRRAGNNNARRSGRLPDRRAVEDNIKVAGAGWPDKRG